jgi:anthranilate synthase component 1
MICYRTRVHRYSLSAAEFADASRRGNLIPLYRELLADGETPVSAYAKLGRDRPNSFLLESVLGGEKWAAYSFLGIGMRALFRWSSGRYEIVVHDVERGGGEPTRRSGPASDPTAALGALLKTFRPVLDPRLPRFFGGAVGYFAYDVVRAFERLPSRHAPDAMPEALFVVTDTIVIFDNLRQTVKVVANAVVDDPADVERSYAAACARIDAIVDGLSRSAPLGALDPSGGGAVSLESNTTREEFKAVVEQAKRYILAGDVFQVVLSQRFSARIDVDPFDVYRALRVVNPSPYMFHLNFGQPTVTGASPEVLVRVENGRVMVRPIAGTRRRGATADDDARLEAELRGDVKENAEHVMLIDLGRNDVGRVAKVGSVRVDEARVVERYSHVMHLVSSVSGEVSAGRDAFDVLRACFPAGTLTGAPKIRAMEIIEELEPCRRGVYGGAVGYVSFGGNLDLCIAIRTIYWKEGAVQLQAGAGIVADSDPDFEYEETVSKARAVVRALEIAKGIGDE